MNKLMILTACLFLSLASFAQPETNFHVSTQGSDKNPGTLKKPFATGTKALEAVTKLKETTGKTAVTVYFHEGIYYGANTLEISEKISGTENFPIVFKAYGDGEVIFHGGKKLTGNNFKLCRDKKVLNRLLPEARGKVWMIDLRKEGVTDFGTFKQHGFGSMPEPSQLELFINGMPQTLARYPNQNMLRIGKVYNKGSVPRVGDFSNQGAEFGYEYDRPGRWTKADDIWLHGKFSHGYNDDNLKVERIDTIKKSIQVVQPHLYGVSSSIYDTAFVKMEKPEIYSYRRYYAYNLLEEIDQPGEYYLDRKSGKLYIYPPSSLDNADIEISLSESPFVSVKSASFIRIEGLTFTCSRGLGIYLENVHGIAIDNCTFSNLGTVAVSMGQSYRSESQSYHVDGSPKQEQIVTHNFENNLISNCVIYNTGTGGVLLTGGDRKNLVKGNNLIYNTEFYNTDRINTTYSPAVKLLGCGNIIRNCYFHDSRHQAIGFLGNDHLIEYCRFDRICYDADDMGAIYTGRDPSSRGTIIQYNYFSNIRPDNKGVSMCGIYFDDGSGGMTVANNFFYRVGNIGRYRRFAAVFMNRGFDNKILKNTFMDCNVAVGQNFWNEASWKKYFDRPSMNVKLRHDVDITSQVYQERYPELKDYFAVKGRRLNLIQENLLINTLVAINGDYLLRRNMTINDTENTPETIDYESVKTYLEGIQPFPFEKCGILNNEK